MAKKLTLPEGFLDTDAIFEAAKDCPLYDFIFNNYTVDYINFLFFSLGLDEPPKSVRKKERAKVLAYYILHKPKSVIKYLTPDEIVWLNELAKQRRLFLNSTESDFAGSSRSHSLRLYSFYSHTPERNMVVMPNDVHEAYSKLLEKEAKVITNNRSNYYTLKRYLCGALNLCGFLSMVDVAQLIMENPDLPEVDQSEFADIITSFQLSVEDESNMTLFSPYFARYDDIAQISAKREHSPIAPDFNFVTAIAAAKFPVPKISVSLHEKTKKELEKIVQPGQTFDQFISQSWITLQINATPVALLKSCLSNLTRDQITNNTIAAIQDLANNMPRQEFYNHTPFYMSKIGSSRKSHQDALEKKRELRQFVQKTFDEAEDDDDDAENPGRYIARNSITPWVNTEPKVGRNDPCPCGSGKKYKNCCGKNN